jgi:hypothetical protein
MLDAGLWTLFTLGKIRVLPFHYSSILKKAEAPKALTKEDDGL